MDGPAKSLLASKTFWGAAVAILAAIAARMGHPILADDQTTLINDGMTMATVIGGLFSIYGRMVAKSPIGK
jgi:branched-subunit amino acid ABC-type transport system permease component